MVHLRRSLGSTEQRSGYFRARYVGPDQGRYEAPARLCLKDRRRVLADSGVRP